MLGRPLFQSEEYWPRLRFDLGRVSEEVVRSSGRVYGEYAENRQGYDEEVFRGRREDVAPGARENSQMALVHQGLDFFSVAGTPVCSPVDAVVCGSGVRPAAGDYGGVIVLEFTDPNEGRRLWVLLGHLAPSSVQMRVQGERIARGSWLGVLGEEQENGGYPPHVHVQVSTLRPREDAFGLDLPGVVSAREWHLGQVGSLDPCAVFDWRRDEGGLWTR